MNVVNKDFRDWFLAYHFAEHLKKETPSLLCLLGGEQNAYLHEILQQIGTTRIVRDLSVFAAEKVDDKAIVLLEATPAQPLCSVLHSALPRSTVIWDIAAVYADYEARRLPKDYLLDEFHVVTEDGWMDYTALRDRISAGYIARYIAKRFQCKQHMLFNKLEIETMNRCNGRCAFCPVHYAADPRPFCQMKESLFLRILKQLAELSYTGALGLFSNNEPLLDRRLPYFAQLARKALPDAFLYIYTNGSLLTETNLPGLLQNLDWIHVDCYTDQPILSPQMEHLRKMCQKWNVPSEKISFHLRNRNELLTTRAGTAPNRTQAVTVKSLCPLPFSQMIVRPDGKVSQCCNDALGRTDYGDLNTQTLEEIWFGEPLESLRRDMLSKGRKASPLCYDCDTIFTSLPYEERSLRNESIPFFPDYSNFSDG